MSDVLDAILPIAGSALGPLGTLGGAALGSAIGGEKAGQADQLTAEEVAQARAQQADRNRLRTAAMNRIGGISQRPDLGSLFSGSQNPFARPEEVPRAPAMAPVGAAPAPTGPKPLDPRLVKLGFR